MENSASIKKKQTILIVGGIVGFILLLMIGMRISDPNRGKPSKYDIAREEAQEVDINYKVRSGELMSAEESWIAKSETRLSKLQVENKELRDTLKEIKRQMNTLADEGSLPAKGTNTKLPQSADLAGDFMRKKSTELANEFAKDFKPVKRSLPVKGDVSNLSRQNQKNQDNLFEEVAPTPTLPTKIDFISLGDLPEKPSPMQENGAHKAVDTEKKLSQKNTSMYLPTGSFATAVLLSGIDAPTGGQAQDNPLPVLMKIMDKGQMPNFFNSDIQDCHVIGAAFGDISSERVMIRLETLTCVLTNTEIVEVAIKGFVSGEDGKNGMRGRVVEKHGALLAKTMLSGFLGGIGRATQQGFSTLTVNPLGAVSQINPSEVGQAGAAQGFAQGMDRLSEYYIQRAEEIYPVIEVSANRIGEIILTGGTKFGTNIIGKTGKQP